MVDHTCHALRVVPLGLGSGSVTLRHPSGRPRSPGPDLPVLIVGESLRWPWSSFITASLTLWVGAGYVSWPMCFTPLISWRMGWILKCYHLIFTETRGCMWMTIQNKSQDRQHLVLWRHVDRGRTVGLGDGRPWTCNCLKEGPAKGGGNGELSGAHRPRTPSLRRVVAGVDGSQWL